MGTKTATSILVLCLMVFFLPISALATPDEINETAPTSESPLGSRENPLPIGTKWNVGDGWYVTVLDVIPEATQIVLDENMFNDPPSSGNQFFLAKIRICYEGENYEFGSLSGGSNFWAVGGSNVAYNYMNGCGVIPDPLPFTDIFRGGCVEGYVDWEIKSDDVDSLVMYHHDYSSLPRVYFSLVDNQKASDDDVIIQTPEVTSPVEVVSNQLPVVNSFEPNKPSPQTAGTSIIFTVDASDPEGDTIYYQFWQNGPDTGNLWRMVRDWGVTNTWIKTTSSSDIGNNQLGVWVRDDQLGHADERNFDDEKVINFQITASVTATESSSLSGLSLSTTTSAYGGPFVGSKNSDVYHYPWCASAKRIKSSNKVTFSSSADARAHGYRPCSKCNPP